MIDSSKRAFSRLISSNLNPSHHDNTDSGTKTNSRNVNLKIYKEFDMTISIGVDIVDIERVQESVDWSDYTISYKD